MNPSLNSYEILVSERIEFEKSATALIKLVGDLFYERNLEVVIFRQQLIDQRPSEMLQVHSHASIMAGETITIQDTLAMAKSLSNSHVRNSTIDVGKLAIEWKREAGIFLKRGKFLDSKLNELYNNENNDPKPIDVVLFGFGRIGRLVARELIAQEGKKSIKNARNSYSWKN
jgi:glyceraldehyde 3-phosphate dehydrogenase